MALRHAGARFPYRFPPPETMVERTLSSVGWMLRSLGSALDEFGCMMQGPAAVKESGTLAERATRFRRCERRRCTLL
eukprot:360633-Chlamydomonas_euryale.AAC.19